MKPLARVNIPVPLMDEMMCKEASLFDVPNSEAGLEFLDWWSRAKLADRCDLTKKAAHEDINIVDAWKQLFEFQVE